jgi:hypothetical protein
VDIVAAFSSNASVGIISGLELGETKDLVRTTPVVVNVEQSALGLIRKAGPPRCCTEALPLKTGV